MRCADPKDASVLARFAVDVGLEVVTDGSPSLGDAVPNPLAAVFLVCSVITATPK